MIPSFKTGSKPELSKSEYDARAAQSSGNFLQDPGTYDLMIKTFTFDESLNQKDSAWIGAKAELESPEGKTMRHSLLIPVECRNSFLFQGTSTFPLEKLQEFLRGLGVQFDYENGMDQVAQVFGDPEQLIGKTIRATLGYKGPHVKYVGKDQFQVVDKDHETPKVDGVFATKEAARAAAQEAGLKYVDKNADYINVTQIFTAKEAVINVTTATTQATQDLPF